MIYVAELDQSKVVIRVVCADGIAWCQQHLGGNWIEAYRDGGARFNFPSTGFVYDEIRDAFIAPKPFASWVLDEETCQWEAPVPVPPGGPWVWDEDLQEWVSA
jgi:hypothetical protein